MKMFKSLAIAAAMLGTMAVSAPAMAQESSYRLGTVWEASRIKILPGQSENYADYLATTWKKTMEAMKAEGRVVSYHVLSTNNRRADEPDVILVVEYKDYQTVAQIEANRARMNALIGQTNRTAAAAGAERGKMREPMGSTQFQELILK